MGYFSLFRSYSFTTQIENELFNGVNVPHTKFSTQGVLQTNSGSGMCNAQNHALRVFCRQISQIKIGEYFHWVVPGWIADPYISQDRFMIRWCAAHCKSH